MKYLVISLSLLISALSAKAQVEKTSELYTTLKSKDSLLFNVGFNTCDISQFRNLISDNFEFYHDQGGITPSKADFVASIENGLCKMDYKPERKLDENSMEVYPLRKNEVLYGAIQNGIHQFYAIEKDGTRYLTSIAKFSHVWLLENGQWKLRRGLSYDHQPVEKPIDTSLLFINKGETERYLKQKHVPALGIGYIENGKIRQISIFGELEKGIPAPENTIWNVASLTKPVTALVALKLVDKGKWNLDEPLYKYYTDPDIADDPLTKKLTTRIVLSHQTGFPNWRKNGKLAFDFEPGTKYQYSGEGFEYLRKAIEKKMGKKLEQLAAELIFKPLKMENTSFTWSENTDERKFAKWHNAKGDMYKTSKNTGANAADDLLTTVADYTTFILYMMNGAGLSSKLQQELTANQVRIKESKYFGLGWTIYENINQQKDIAMSHGGSDIGVQTIVFITPKTKNGLLIFTNTDNGTAVFEDILLKYLGKDGQRIFNIEMK